MVRVRVQVRHQNYDRGCVYGLDKYVNDIQDVGVSDHFFDPWASLGLVGYFTGMYGSYVVAFS